VMDNSLPDIPLLQQIWCTRLRFTNNAFQVICQLKVSPASSKFGDGHIGIRAGQLILLFVRTKLEVSGLIDRIFVSENSHEIQEAPHDLVMG
jgi:hypothetical protein